MKTRYFKVTLLSDVIINQRAATEGNQKTLDFIPGNAFLGVAAGELYKTSNSSEGFALFHSGKVRFGDAHTVIDGKRTLKVPASLYKKKDDQNDSELFVHHGIPKDGLKDENGNPIQIKQYRENFIVKQEGDHISTVKINKHFAIKSAYDSAKRRSEDAKMYGYESLQAGTEYGFELVMDDDLEADLEEKLVRALEGNKRIGRSSTAQYGLVKIEQQKELPIGFEKWDEPKARDIEEPVVFIYAESRLIFLDMYGQPTFTPTVKDFGFQDDKAKICWEMSQIRTFQYAPYNNKRKTRDADRCGIEKGSVFCIIGKTSSEKEMWVGSYQNEGFGKVLINPEFLEYVNDLGKAKIFFTQNEAISKSKEFGRPAVRTNDKPVLSFLKDQELRKENQKFIYKRVNSFVKNNSERFKGDSFASQWGTIRSLAMQFQNPTTLKEKLYLNDDSYLKHGVAADKWKERGRIELLTDFVKSFDTKDDTRETKKDLLPEAIINLAAEMAKKCRRD